MECPLCGHPKPHKHGKTSKGTQGYYMSQMWTNFHALLLTLYTIVGKLNQKKCPWFYKLMLRVNNGSYLARN